MSDLLDLVSKIKGKDVGTSMDEVLTNLELVSQLYTSVSDPELKELIRVKVNELVDYLFDNDLVEGVELTKFMLYD